MLPLRTLLKPNDTVPLAPDNLGFIGDNVKDCKEED